MSSSPQTEVHGQRAHPLVGDPAGLTRMSAHNRVVWSEGLFLQPQHFQQQDRYLERYVESRCEALDSATAGASPRSRSSAICLRIGKFGLRRAAGVFPDGTPVRMPDDDPAAGIRSTSAGRCAIRSVYLAVPLRRDRIRSTSIARGTATSLARHALERVGSARRDVGVAEIRRCSKSAVCAAGFCSPSEVTQAYACIPLAHLVECRADKQVVLDDAFMPTVLYTRASTRLATFVTELLGLLHQRGEALGGRVAATGRGGSAEIADFLLLQAVNRFEPLIAHYAESASVHPEELFRVCVSAAGELATFTTPSKRPPALAGLSSRSPAANPSSR